MSYLVGIQAAELHVAITGNDTNPGTAAAPLRTIQHAADLAQPGDVVTVHTGVYRERINPPRGGESDTKRIVYQAAPGEVVEIKGSELIKDWERVQNDTWKTTLPNSFFGNFNPYAAPLAGRWYLHKTRTNHPGSVYLNGAWLAEAVSLQEVLKPASESALWFGQVDKGNTTIWAQFKGVDPKEQRVEINVRQSVFYPSQPGRNFITVRGFTMRHAATPWAPPDMGEQIGLLGTHWSKGWIIENNTVSHSICAGITLGKGNASHFYTVISPPGKNKIEGWSKERIGSHIVRNNTVSHCEMAGICGSLGAIFSTISNNVVHDIHVRRSFSGAEMAGIKLHAAIDVEISGNHVYRCARGLWLDWMAQGTRVTRNLFHDNASAAVDWANKPEANIPGGEQDMFVEVNHGPFLVDNNLFLSPYSVNNRSRSGMYVHNIFAGHFRIVPFDTRKTPYFRAHSTEIVGLHNAPAGDDRYYNNLFIGKADLQMYDSEQLPNWNGRPIHAAGNVYVAGALPSKQEKTPLVNNEFDPAIKLTGDDSGWRLEMIFEKAWWQGPPRPVITTQLLGIAALPGVPFENPDGSPVSIDRDFFGKPRDPSNPTVGPFEKPGDGRVSLKLR